MARGFLSERLAFGLALGAAVAAFAAGNTCTWTGLGGDGKWSTAANWQDAGGVGNVPLSGNEDTLVFASGAAALTVENDIDNLVVGSIVTTNSAGTVATGVTLTGKAFTITGASADTTRFTGYCATTFDMPLTLGVAMKLSFKATANFNFNCDLTLDTSGTVQWTGAYPKTITPSLYFRGTVTGPNAQFNAVHGTDNGFQYFYHYGPVVVRQYDAGTEYKTSGCHFYSVGNDIKTLRAVGYGIVYAETANAFAADNQLVQISTAYGPSVGGKFHVKGDTTLPKITVDATKGSKRTAIFGSKTLTLAASEDHALPYWSVNDTAGLRWAPTGDYSLSLSNATNATSGAVFVDRGSLKIGGTVTFTQLTKMVLADQTTLEIASGSADCFGTSPNVALYLGSSTAVKLDADVKVKSLFVGGAPIAAGAYRGADGATGTVVPWITGGGTLTVMSAATGTAWIASGDGDWNTAANWTSGVPATTNSTAYLRRYGNYTVSVDAVPESPAGSFQMDNFYGTTLLDISAKLSFLGSVSLGAGAHVNVGAGGEWYQDFSAASSAASGTETFALKDDAVFTVDGGAAVFTNTTGQLSIGGSDGSAGTFEVKSGDVRVKRSGGNCLRLYQNGLIKMTGGTFTYTAGDAFGQYGGTIDLSGDAKLIMKVDGFLAMFRTLTLKIGGNASVRKSVSTQSRWYLTPNAAGEVCRIELDDHGLFDYADDALSLCQRSGAKTIVTLRGHSRLNAANGFHIGDAAGGTGEVVLYDQSYLHDTYYAYGANFGTAAGSAANPAKGILRMHGGAFYTGRSPNSTTTMQGLIFGNGLSSSAAGPIAIGEFEMTGGVITNINNAVVAFGGGMATGTGVQSGGFLFQKSTQPVLIGFRGGTGTYDMSGGCLLAKGSAFVGGAQTNVINYYLKALADRPATGRLTVTGGSFETEKSLFVSGGGYGTLEVGAAGVVKVGSDLYLTNSVDAVASAVAPAKLKFTAGANGCGVIQVTKKIQIAEDAELTVDLTAFEGTRSFPLVESTAIEGAFSPAKITILAPNPGIYSVRQDATGLRLMVNTGTTLFIR